MGVGQRKTNITQGTQEKQVLTQVLRSCFSKQLIWVHKVTKTEVKPWQLSLYCVAGLFYVAEGTEICLGTNPAFALCFRNRRISGGGEAHPPSPLPKGIQFWGRAGSWRL